MRPLLTSCLALLAMMLVACDDDGSGTTVDTFDRRPMLVGVADVLVRPGYAAATARAEDVARRVRSLNADLTEADVIGLRGAVDSLTAAWQAVVLYDFGPADGPLGSLAENIATFPVDSQGVEAFVAAGDTSFANFRRDTRGLATLDYLLARGSANDVRSALSGTAGAGRRAYLAAVANAIYAELLVVLTAWNGTYRDQFVSRTGTDAGSSVSLLFNHLNIGFELLKNFKIGLPLGKRAGQTAVEPTRVEAYYRGTSLALARAHFDACVQLWYGRAANGTTFPSFRSYLLTVPNGQRLIDDTEAQISRVEGAFTARGTTQPLSDLVVTNPAALEPLHTELQKLTRFWKSEMSSLLGIAITYSSGDGD